MKRLLAFARSPRVALALILGTGLYIGAVTAVPQAAIMPAEHAEWVATATPWVRLMTALGFDRAHTNPVFLVIALCLGVSTAVCSWDRSVLAWRRWRLRAVLDESLRKRMDAARPKAFAGSTRDAIAAVRQALETQGMRVRAGQTAGYAEARPSGLFGSPIFHWSLVALIVFAALGFLTRWEGLIGVPERVDVVDAAPAYGKLERAPLALPQTGWSLRVEGVEDDKRIGKVYYGVVPTVSVRDGDREVARDEVYPNHPLRAGPLLIHISDHGLSASVEVADETGAVLGKTDRILDFDDTTQSGTVVVGFDVGDGESLVASVSIEIAARDVNGELPRLLPPDPSVIFTIDDVDGSTIRRVVRKGESLTLSQGWTLRVADVGYYARLSVVRDWSVAWIYGFLVVAIIGLVWAVLLPYRAVWFRVEPRDGEADVRVVVFAPRADAGFSARVDAALAKTGVGTQVDADDDGREADG